MSQLTSDRGKEMTRMKELPKFRVASSRNNTNLITETINDSVVVVAEERDEDEDLDNVPDLVDFRKWIAAAALAKKDAEAKALRCSSDDEGRDDHDCGAFCSLSLKGLALETLVEEEEVDEREEVNASSTSENFQTATTTATREKKDDDAKIRKLLQERLRFEKAKNRVYERNVKAEALAMARRILAEEKRRKGEKSLVSVKERVRAQEEKTNEANIKINFEERYKERTELMKRRKEARQSSSSSSSSSLSSPNAATTTSSEVGEKKASVVNNGKPEWNDSFATEQLPNRFPEAPIRSPITVEELRRREKEKRKEALKKKVGSSTVKTSATRKSSSSRSSSSSSSRSSLTSVLQSSRRLFN